MMLLLIGLYPFFSTCQYAEIIRLGRPGSAIGGYTVGRHVIQFQNDYGFARNSIGDSLINNSHNIGSVVRLGLTESFEFAIGAGYKITTVLEEDIHGFDKVFLRSRFNILEEEKNIPSLGVQLELGMPRVSKEFGSTNLTSKITLAGGKKFLGNLILINLRGMWFSQNDLPQGAGIINVSRAIKDFQFMLEERLEWTSNSWGSHSSVGIAYFLKDDLKMDLFARINNRGFPNEQRLYLSLGLHGRIDKLYKSEK